jgi:hypothetical protein
MVYCGPLAPIHPSGLPVPPELTDEDCEWVREQLELSGWQAPEPGMKPPVLDTSWLTTTTIRR